jgi:hypothetical protein
MFGFLAIFNAFRSFLSGKKTYGIALIVLISVFAEKFLGWDVPGFTVPADWQDVVLAAFGLSITMRAAITKIIKNYNLK